MCSSSSFPGSDCLSPPNALSTPEALAFSPTPCWGIKTVWFVAFCPSVGLFSKIIMVLSAFCVPELTPLGLIVTHQVGLWAPLSSQVVHSDVAFCPCGVPCPTLSKVVVTPLYPTCQCWKEEPDVSKTWLKFKCMALLMLPSMHFKVQNSLICWRCWTPGSRTNPTNVWPYSLSCLLVRRLILDLAPYKVTYLQSAQFDFYSIFLNLWQSCIRVLLS